MEVTKTGAGEMTKLAEEMKEYEDEDEISEDAMTGSETEAAEGGRGMTGPLSDWPPWGDKCKFIETSSCGIKSIIQFLAYSTKLLRAHVRELVLLRNRSQR